MYIQTTLPTQTLVNMIALALQAQVSFLLIGPPGFGKTSIIRAICKVLNKHLEVFEVPGKHSMHDVIGAPLKKRFVPPKGSKGNAGTKWWCQDYMYLDYILNCVHQPGSVIFFDDFASIPYQMQELYLPMIGLERKFGNLHLEHTSICAAASPRGKTLGIKPSLLDRCLLIPWVPEHEEMIFAMSQNFPDPLVPIISETWRKDYLPERQSEIAAFLDQNQERLALVTNSARSTDKMAEGVPSYRAWTMVASMLAAYDSVKHDTEMRHRSLVRWTDDVEIRLMISGLVGAFEADEYRFWVRGMNLPEPQAVLADPKPLENDKFDLRPWKTARLMVLLPKITGYVIRLGDTDEGKDAWYAAWNILGGLVANFGEGRIQFMRRGFVYRAAMALLENRPSRAQEDPSELSKHADWIWAMTKKFALSQEAHSSS